MGRESLPRFFYRFEKGAVLGEDAFVGTSDYSKGYLNELSRSPKASQSPWASYSGDLAGSSDLYGNAMPLGLRGGVNGCGAGGYAGRIPLPVALC